MQFKRTLGNCLGQGTMEYILILVIVVALILSLTAQFYQPLQAFINTSMGGYVSCLLESGQLPALGNQEDVGDEACIPPKLEKVAYNPKEGSSEAGGGTDENAARAKARQNSRTSGGSTGGSGTGSSRGQSFGSSGTPRRAGSSEGGTAGPKVVEISIGSTPEGGFRRSSSGGSSQLQNASATKPVIVYGLTSEERQKVEKEKGSATRVIAGDGAGEAKPKKFLMKTSKQDGSTKDLQVEAWSIGDYLRIFLICAIVVVLLLLIGGQIARLSKESD